MVEVHDAASIRTIIDSVYLTFIHVHYALLLVKVDLHLKLMVEFENKTYLGLQKPNI